MKKTFYQIAFFIFSSITIFAQDFSSRKILIENLGAPIGPNNIIFVNDVVYCKLINDKIHFISHIDDQLNLYDYENGVVSDLGNIGALNGFIVDTYDHNSDGNTDILGHFQIKLGQGNSMFNDQTSPIDGTTQGRIYRAVDFDNDGITDIMTRELSFSGGTTETIFIYLLNSDQQIESTISFIADEELLDAQIFDLDLDGNMDVIYTIDIFGDNRLVIQMNNGDGTFTEQNIGVHNTESIIVAEDFDKDDDLDILITGFNGSNIEIVSNENGIFTDDEQIISTGRIYNLSTADFDNDGHLDLVYLENENFDSLRIMIANGLGDGSFASPSLIGKVAFNGVSFVNSFEQASEDWLSTCDYDQDGDPDILVNATLEQQYIVFENMGTVNTNDYFLNADLIEIYPNPVSNYLSCNTELTLKKIEIMDTNGIVRSKTNGEKKIDISHLENGMFFLKFTDAQGQIYMSKFMKQ